MPSTFVKRVSREFRLIKPTLIKTLLLVIPNSEVLKEMKAETAHTIAIKKNRIPTGAMFFPAAKNIKAMMVKAIGPRKRIQCNFVVALALQQIVSNPTKVLWVPPEGA